MSKSKPVQIFVAMPYSNLGPKAKWSKPAAVEDFYEKLGKRLEDRIQRPVVVRIEKYSAESGLVFEKMFRAIRDSDVFIADLTGSNANVFLELGVRLGTSHGITILTTQEDDSPPFDVNQMRLIRYANGPTDVAENQILDLITSELDSGLLGSPVLRLLDLEVVDRRKWETITGIRSERLLAQAKQEAEKATKMALIEEAIETDPYHLPARLEMVRLLRSGFDFDRARDLIHSSLRLFPASAPLYKELGILFDKMTVDGKDYTDDSLEAFETGLIHDKEDSDLHACLGGALRRKALACADSKRELFLRRSLQEYETSMRFDRHSTYAGLNILRVLILMSDTPSESFRGFEEYIERMYHLCSFECADARMNKSDGAWWKMFDLADVLAMKNQVDEAIRLYEAAIARVPDAVRNETLQSPLRSWMELIEATQPNEGLARHGEALVNVLMKSKVNSG